MMKYMYYSVRNVIKHTKVNFKSESYIALLLFILFSWGVLNFWNYLMQLINEDIDSTLPSSWLIRVMIIIAAFSCLFQKRPGVLIYLVTLTLGLIITFILCVTVFHLIFNMLPDFSDFVFYYECFLLASFCGLPICLFIRII